MSLIKDITSSFFWRGITIVANFFIGIILARHLTVEDRGEFALIILTITILCLFINFGVPDATIYLTGQNKYRKDNLLITGLLYNLIVAIIVLSIALLFLIMNLSIFKLSLSLKYVYIVGILSIIPQSVTSFLALFLLGIKKVIVYNRFMASLAILQLLFVTVFAFFFELTLYKAVLSNTISTVLGLFIIFLYIKQNKISYSVSLFNKTALKDMLLIGKQFFFTGLGGLAIQRINYKFLEKYQNSAAVGVYAVASSLPNFLSVIPAQLATVLYSWVSNAKTEQEKNRVATIIFKSAFWISLLVSLFLLFSLQYIIVFLYGSNYKFAVVPAYYLLFSVLTTGLTGILLNYLLGCGLSKTGSKLTVINILSLVLGAVMLIPKLGVLGAAISTFISSLIGFVYILNNFLRYSKLTLKQLFIINSTDFKLISLQLGRLKNKFGKITANFDNTTTTN